MPVWCSLFHLGAGKQAEGQGAVHVQGQALCRSGLFGAVVLWIGSRLVTHSNYYTQGCSCAAYPLPWPLSLSLMNAWLG